MEATQEVDFVESFDALWEGVCKDIFSIIYYAYILEYVCIKIHSYNSPPLSIYDFQGASPHVLCLRNINALMHDHGIQHIHQVYYQEVDHSAHSTKE